MEVLLVVTARMQAPGVLVAVIVNDTTPFTAVAEPLPAENVPPVPVPTAVMLQTLAELASRVTVSTVTLSLITVLPFASWMLIVRPAVEFASAPIGLRLRLA